MITDLFLAIRFLREGRSQTLLIIAGVVLGSAVVVFLTALLSGLQASLIAQTLGSQPHIVVHAPRDAASPVRFPQPGEEILRQHVEPEQRLRSIVAWQSLVRRLEMIPGVEAVSPIAMGPATAVRGAATRSVVVFAGDAQRLDRVIPLRSKIVAGRYSLGGGEVLIGTDLAEDLGVGVGDVLRMRPTSAAGQRFRIAGIFDLGIREVNQRWVVLPLRSGQTLLALPGGVSDLHLRIDDVFAADGIADRVAADTGLEADSWMRTNEPLMSGLRAQSDSGNLITLFVVIAVAMGISSVLVVSVVQKSGEIGILRACGASRSLVMRVFLWQGAALGLFGSLGGCALGFGLGRLFERVGANPDGTARFPVAEPTSLFVATIVGSVLVGLVAAAWPARRAAALDPVVAIRNA